MLLCIYSVDCWLLAFAFKYVAMDCLVFIVFHFMDTLVLIVIYRDFLCYLVYRPQGCNKLELTVTALHLEVTKDRCCSPYWLCLRDDIVRT